MAIPEHIKIMARNNAMITGLIANIYKYHDIYVIIPKGYDISDDAILLGYATPNGHVIESGKSDDNTTDNQTTDN